MVLQWWVILLSRSHGVPRNVYAQPSRLKDIALKSKAREKSGAFHISSSWRDQREFCLQKHPQRVKLKKEMSLAVNHSACAALCLSLGFILLCPLQVPTPWHCALALQGWTDALSWVFRTEGGPANTQGVILP